MNRATLREQRVCGINTIMGANHRKGCLNAVRAALKATGGSKIQRTQLADDRAVLKTAQDYLSGWGAATPDWKRVKAIIAAVEKADRDTAVAARRMKAEADERN
jgi:hypothetical protein